MTGPSTLYHIWELVARLSPLLTKKNGSKEDVSYRVKFLAIVLTAYRAELDGLTAIALFFNTLTIPVTSSINQTVYSDCQSALNKLVTSPEYAKVKFQHMDLISIICDLWSSCTFLPTDLHVYGHQDGHPSHILPVESQLNL